MGRQIMAEVALTLPFKINAYGSVTSTTDQAKIWADRVRFVIGTNLEERILDPQFGTLVPEAFMQTADDAEALIAAEVERAFPLQLELLTFQSVDISYDDYSGTTNVNITYSLPNGEVTDTVVAVTYIGGNNQSVQENL
jgi:phage baseplate assembly protein W